MAVFVWSDLHLNHKNILRYRPNFRNLKEHEDYILTQLSETLDKRDKIYLLGDNSFDLDGFNKIMSAIPKGVVVVYMGGNHDFERNKTYFRDVAANQRVAEFGAGLMKERTYKMWMSHAPIHPSELEYGIKVNVHGHIHDNIIPDRRFVNVSVDNVGKPVNLETIRRYIKSGDETPFSYFS